MLLSFLVGLEHDPPTQIEALKVGSNSSGQSNKLKGKSPWFLLLELYLFHGRMKKKMTLKVVGKNEFSIDFVY